MQGPACWAARISLTRAHAAPETVRSERLVAVRRARARDAARLPRRLHPGGARDLQGAVRRAARRQDGVLPKRLPPPWRAALDPRGRRRPLPRASLAQRAGRRAPRHPYPPGHDPGNRPRRARQELRAPVDAEGGAGSEAARDRGDRAGGRGQQSPRARPVQGPRLRDHPPHHAQAAAEPLTRRAGIVTVGHSNRTLRAFVELLEAHRVKTIADVRKLRGSRAVPHFGERTLRGALGRAEIGYVAIPQLAGRRGKSADPSPRPCWRNRGFRNYADHMRTAEFQDGIRRLIALARGGRVAVMCAEAVPWRCHRSLIADHLVIERRRRVDELVGDRARPHRLTACARIVRGRLSYDLPRARAA